MPIKPPSNLAPKPDKDTRKELDDLTGTEATGRVLFINIGFFRYGTDDKIHAAAIVLSMVLLIMIVGVLLRASGQESAWNDKVFNWLGGAFLFVAGIALGKGGSDHRPKHD